MTTEIEEWHVKWEIEVDDVGSHQAAAEKALGIQRDPSSIATVFEVTAPDGTVETIDLTPDA